MPRTFLAPGPLLRPGPMPPEIFGFLVEVATTPAVYLVISMTCGGTAPDSGHGSAGPILLTSPRPTGPRELPTLPTFQQGASNSLVGPILLGIFGSSVDKAWIPRERTAG